MFQTVRVIRFVFESIFNYFVVKLLATIVSDRPREPLMDDRRDVPRNPVRSQLRTYEQEEFIETRQTTYVHSQPEPYDRDEYHPQRESNPALAPQPPQANVHHYTVLNIQPSVKYNGRPDSSSGYKPDIPGPAGYKPDASGPVDEEVITPMERKVPPTPLFTETNKPQVEPSMRSSGRKEVEPAVLRKNQPASYHPENRPPLEPAAQLRKTQPASYHSENRPPLEPAAQLRKNQPASYHSENRPPLEPVAQLRKNQPSPMFAEPKAPSQPLEPTPLRSSGRRVPLETEIVDLESSPSSKVYATASEEVRYEAPTILNKLKKIAVVAGDDIEMKCTIEGYPKPFVQWYRNSIPINGDGRISPSEVCDSVFHTNLSKDSPILICYFDVF